MLKNIMRTLAFLVLFNFIGFWIAKMSIAYRLSTVVYTEFGIKAVIFYGYAGMVILATYFAFGLGWRDDE